MEDISCSEASLPEMLARHPSLAQALRHMEGEVAQGRFTAWSLSDGKSVLSAFQADEWKRPDAMARLASHHLHPRFDLASLTKPLFLGALIREHLPAACGAMPLGALLLERNPKHFLGPQLARWASSLTLDDLLNHRAGFEAGMLMGAGRKSEFMLLLCEQILKRRQQNPQDGVVYSDLSSLVAAQALGALMGWDLKGWQEALKNLNKKQGTSFDHSSLCVLWDSATVPSWPYRSVDSGEARAQREKIFAQHPVHDHNAAALMEVREVSGHAGLSGSAFDVTAAAKIHVAALFAGAAGDTPLPHPDRFLKGLDTPGSAETLAGLDTFPPSHFVCGHLGYTGVSFWAQPHTGQVQCVLTNRTSRRKSQGLSLQPRLLVLTKTNSDSQRETAAWSLETPHTDPSARLGREALFLGEGSAEKAQPLGMDGLDALMEIHAGGRVLLRDTEELSPPASISETRRRMGQLLWKGLL